MSPEGPRRRQKPPEGIATTANDEIKGGYSRLFAGGLLVAVLAHFTLFELFPQFNAAEIGTTAEAPRYGGAAAPARDTAAGRFYPSVSYGSRKIGISSRSR